LAFHLLIIGDPYIPTRCHWQSFTALLEPESVIEIKSLHGRLWCVNATLVAGFDKRRIPGEYDWTSGLHKRFYYFAEGRVQSFSLVLSAMLVAQGLSSYVRLTTLR
jgi:hypothetical protein